MSGALTHLASAGQALYKEGSEIQGHTSLLESLILDFSFSVPKSSSLFLDEVVEKPKSSVHTQWTQGETQRKADSHTGDFL